MQICLLQLVHSCTPTPRRGSNATWNAQSLLVRAKNYNHEQTTNFNGVHEQRKNNNVKISTFIFIFGLEFTCRSSWNMEDEHFYFFSYWWSISCFSMCIYYGWELFANTHTNIVLFMLYYCRGAPACTGFWKYNVKWTCWEKLGVCKFSLIKE